MSFQVPTAPPPSASPPTSGASPPGGPPGEALLHSAFAETLARTALAEGLNQSHSDGEPLHAHGSPRQGTHEHRDAIAGDRAATELASTSAGVLAQAPPQPAAEERASTAAAPTTTTTTEDAAAAAGADPQGRSAEPASAAAMPPASDAQPGAAPAASANQAGAPAQTDGGGQMGAAVPPAGATHLPASEAAAVSQPPTVTPAPASGTTSPSVETPPMQPMASAAPSVSAGETAEQATAPTAPVLAQGSSGGAAGAQGSDTPKVASSAPPVTPSPKPTVEAPSVAESSLAPSAPAPSQSVAGETTAPTPKSATTTGSVDATIAKEGAVATGTTSHLAPAASAGGSESQQAPTQQREGAAHALTQTSVVGPASGGDAISSTAAVPPQQGKAALISAPDPLATALAPSQAGGVALQDMIESIHATVELAARQGMAQARIALEPEELGSLRIHLSQTADGLLARVSADTPAAAQALAGGRAELHQSLSSLGVSLLRLDINSFGQSDTRDSSGRSTSGESQTSSAAAPDPGAESDLAAEHETPSPTLLSSGALVDVLA